MVMTRIMAIHKSEIVEIRNCGDPKYNYGDQYLNYGET